MTVTNTLNAHPYGCMSALAHTHPSLYTSDVRSSKAMHYSISCATSYVPTQYRQLESHNAKCKNMSNFQGEDAGIAEFPFMALLGFRGADGEIQYVCGGSLINRWYVLTATHCMRSALGDPV